MKSAVISVVAGLALFGCSHPAEKSNERATEELSARAPAAPVPVEDEASVSLAEHHRHHQGGVTAFIALSLDSLGVDPARQARVEKIQASLNAELAPVREAETKVVLTLADGIAAGSVDKAKVDAEVVQLGTAASGVHDASAGTINELHQALSPLERVALVHKVRAHWEVWRKVNHEVDLDRREQGSRLANLADELNLTSDQIETISANLTAATVGLHAKFDPAGVEAHVAAFSKAFVGDSFDATTLSAGTGVNGHLAAHGATRMAIFYEAVAPQLTAVQRTLLATNLHEHLTHQQANAGK